MKYISIYDLSEELDNTVECRNCCQHGALNDREEKNDFDRVFEQFVRGTLRYIDNDWYLEFTDENYTWFMLRWS